MLSVLLSHTFFRKIIGTIIFCATASILFSQINITTDNVLATYDSGASMNFEVTSTVSGLVQWELEYDEISPKISTGSFNIIAGQTKLIPYASTEPSMVICKVTQNGVTEEATAAFNPLEILPYEEEPADFDAFWNSKKADLAAVPMNPNLTVYTIGQYTVTYQIELDNVDNRKVYGYLTIPNGAGPFPAVIVMPPFGVNASVTVPEETLSEFSGMIAFTVSVHNVPADQEDPNAYSPDNYTDPDGNYYKYGMLGAVRAIDYIETMSEFNGENVAVMGVSQGAGLAINVAGLDDRVNLLTYGTPTLSQMTGLHYDREGSFINYVARSRALDGTLAHELQTMEAVKYYDAIYFARRYTGPTLASISYEDLLSPAATGFASFNQLGGPKIVVHELDLDHDNTEEYWLGRYDLIRRFIPSSIDVVPRPYVATTKGYLIDAGTDVISSGNVISLSGTIEKNDAVDDENFDPTWKLISGPGTVSFNDATAYNTTATFSNVGDYVLEFSGTDYSKLNSDRRFFTLIDYKKVTVQSANGDSAPPEVTLSTPSNTVDGDFVVTASFTENVTGLTLNDFVVSNGTASLLSGSGNLYTFTITPTNEGDVTLFLPQQTVIDAAGNPSIISNVLVIDYEIEQTGNCNNPTNLALGKTSTQHSTQLNAVASRANDGNTNGDFWAANSTTLTNWVSNSWWEVDLGAVGDIESINIWNRSDCCGNFLSDYHVFVSDVPFTSTNLNTTINQAGVANFYEAAAASYPTTLPINRTGRYVRVQLAGVTFLAIAEVEVMGCFGGGGTPIDQTISFDPISDKLTTASPFAVAASASSGLPVSYAVLSGPATMNGNIVSLNGTEGTVVIEATQLGNVQYNPASAVTQSFSVIEPDQGNCNSPSNLSFGKTATQSGTQLGAVASRAIDGNTNGNFWADNSCSLTNWVSNAWWEVDLEAVAEIESIKLWNRTDCCENLFSNVYILVSQVPFTSTNLNTTLNQAGVTDFLISGDVGLPSDIPINALGRYVRIQLAGTAYLSIAEVEVMGCVDGNGCAPAGTACNDNNPGTFDDIEDGGCLCEGTPCPASGTTCDDGNANTENDVEDGFCNCAGTPIGGGCATTTNLALNQNVTQSSTLTAAGIIGNAEKAVDGNTNGVFFTGNNATSSVTATTFGSDNWWEVDLGGSYSIEEINVFNRTDGADRTTDIYVLISNNPFTSSDLAGARAEADFEEFISGNVGSPSVVEPLIEGRYVRIQRSTSGYLVLAEVEVFGCAAVGANSNNNTLIINPYQYYLNFDVEKEGRNVALNWVTNTEIENDFFIIEKSKDGILFEPMLEVDSKTDEAGASFYDEIDDRPSFGKNYYRLHQFAKNGSSRYSPIRMVDFDLDLNELQIYPNPAHEKIHVNLESFIGEDVSIQIFDARGVLMMEKDFIELEEGVQTFELDQFVNGLYMMTIKVEGKKIVTKQFVTVRM